MVEPAKTWSSREFGPSAHPVVWKVSYETIRQWKASDPFTTLIVKTGLLSALKDETTWSSREFGPSAHPVVWKVSYETIRQWKASDPFTTLIVKTGLLSALKDETTGEIEPKSDFWMTRLLPPLGR